MDSEGQDQPAHPVLYGPSLSQDTTEYMNGERRPSLYFAHAQDDLISRMLEGTFRLTEPS